MVRSLAVSSVDHKIKNHLSILIGNYEFYYAAGVFSQKVELDHSNINDPVLLDKEIKEKISSFTPENDREEYLISILKKFEVNIKESDEDMIALFKVGSESKVLIEDE